VHSPSHGRVLAIPALCYLGITLGVPLVRGAWASAAFWRHAAIVVGLCAAVVALLTLARAALRRGPTGSARARRCRRLRTTHGP
jgi:hypothetical protein